MSKKQATGVDLNDLKPYGEAERPHRFELMLPELKDDDGKVVRPATGTGIFISVLGTNSQRYQRAKREAENESLKRHFETERGKAEEIVPSMDLAIQKAADILATLTVGWENIDLDGKELKFSHDAAAKLYCEQDWIRKQVDEQANNLGNFI